MKKLFIPLAINTIILFLILYLSMAVTGGGIHYALDDAYIHMAIAKNIVNYGVYGVGPEQIAFASSSPVWTALLSFIFLFTQSEAVPMILSIFFSYLIVLATYLIAREMDCTKNQSALASIFVILFMPMTPIVFGGMDQIVHIFFFLLLILFFIKSEKDNKFNNIFYAVSIIAGGSRIENLFITAPICVYLFYKKEYKKSIIFLICCISIFTIHGVYSYHMGEYPLPTSIVAKGGVIDTYKSYGMFTAINYGFVKTVFKTPIMNMLIILCIVIFLTTKNKTLSLIILSNIILHMSFAETGWFYRYEAYLVCVVLILCAKYINHNKLLTILIIAFLLYCGSRSAWANFSTPFAVKNTYEQQYQMGRFVKEYYNNDTVLLNDLGGIAYHSDANIIDIAGLASVDFVRAKKAGLKDSEYIDNYAKEKNVSIGIIYDTYIKPYGGVPPRWNKVAEWNITWTITAGDEFICFYSLNENKTEQLIQNLHEFEDELPEDVRVGYYY